MRKKRERKLLEYLLFASFENIIFFCCCRWMKICDLLRISESLNKINRSKWGDIYAIPHLLSGCLFVCQLNGLQKQHTISHQWEWSSVSWTVCHISRSWIERQATVHIHRTIHKFLYSLSCCERTLDTRRRLKCVQKSVKHSNCASRHVQTDRSLSSTSMQLLLRLKVHDCAPSRITFSRSDFVAEISSERAFLACRINHLSSRALRLEALLCTNICVVSQQTSASLCISDVCKTNSRQLCRSPIFFRS